jgi:hypothetical protein
MKNGFNGDDMWLDDRGVDPLAAPLGPRPGELAGNPFADPLGLGGGMPGDVLMSGLPGMGFSGGLKEWAALWPLEEGGLFDSPYEVPPDPSAGDLDGMPYSLDSSGGIGEGMDFVNDESADGGFLDQETGPSVLTGSTDDLHEPAPVSSVSRREPASTSGAGSRCDEAAEEPSLNRNRELEEDVMRNKLMWLLEEAIEGSEEAGHQLWEVLEEQGQYDEKSRAPQGRGASPSSPDRSRNGQAIESMHAPVWSHMRRGSGMRPAKRLRFRPVARYGKSSLPLQGVMFCPRLRGIITDEMCREQCCEYENPGWASEGAEAVPCSHPLYRKMQAALARLRGARKE